MAGENPNNEAPQSAEERGGAPETQVKPWWEVRGFKSESDGLASLDASRTELTAAQQRVAELDRTLKAVVTKDPVTPPEKKVEAGYKRFYEGLGVEEAYNSGDPVKMLEVHMAAMDRLQAERTVELIERHDNLREIRRSFYDENKDIAPYQDLVKTVSAEVGMEFPQMTLGDAMKEVAKRVRARVVAIKSGKEVPVAPGATEEVTKTALPHTGAGGQGNEASVAATPRKEEPVVNDVESEVTRRAAERAKRSVLR